VINEQYQNAMVSSRRVRSICKCAGRRVRESPTAAALRLDRGRGAIRKYVSSLIEAAAPSGTTLRHLSALAGRCCIGWLGFDRRGNDTRWSSDQPVLRPCRTAASDRRRRMSALCHAMRASTGGHFGSRRPDLSATPFVRQSRVRAASRT